MHLRIYPKLGIEAGFELNTDININSVPPESAAKSLREINP
jgi:UDPglucose--hexose-1-phosphate uridylyltransferase